MQGCTRNAFQQYSSAEWPQTGTPEALAEPANWLGNSSAHHRTLVRLCQMHTSLLPLVTSRLPSASKHRPLGRRRLFP